MGHSTRQAVLMLVICFSVGESAFATCTAYQYNPSTGAMQQVTNSGNAYYIDPLGGSDSNNGTSSATPWRHHPFETGAAFSGQVYTHTAGDCFYFKGGVSVTNANLGIIVNAGGSAAAGSDYYGPDPNHTWFTGASWTRPIFDQGGTSATTGPGNTVFDVSAGAPFVTIDYFEIKGQFTNDALGGSAVAVGLTQNVASITVSRNYIHGWQYPVGSTRDQLFALLQDTQANGNYFVYNIIDGTDSPSPHKAYQGPFHCCTVVNYNIIHDTGNGFNTQCCNVGPREDVSYNLFYNLNDSFDGLNHTALVEPSTASSVHDNVAHDVGTAVLYDLASDGNVGHLLFYNNVGWNQTAGKWWLITSGFGAPCSGSCGTVDFYNNTLEAGGQATIRWGIPAPDVGNLFNNHLINCGGASTSLTDCETFTGTPTTINSGTNLIQTLSAARAAGYTSSQTFAYSPTTQNGPTVGAGTNETSLCSATVHLCVDSSYGVTQSGSTPGTAIPVLARSQHTRPSTGGWDIGAHLFNSASSGQPNAPTGLSAAVN